MGIEVYQQANYNVWTVILNNLRFVDDTDLVAESPRQLQELTDRINYGSQSWTENKFSED